MQFENKHSVNTGVPPSWRQNKSLISIQDNDYCFRTKWMHEKDMDMISVRLENQGKSGRCSDVRTPGVSVQWGRRDVQKPECGQSGQILLMNDPIGNQQWPLSKQNIVSQGYKIRLRYLDAL